MKYLFSFLSLSLYVCVHSQLIRLPVDTIGFATKSFQMDSIMARINRGYKAHEYTGDKPVKLAICPHDDYTYVGQPYKESLSGLSAKTVIIFGVNHKAKGMDNHLIFDNFDSWAAPYGPVKVSSLREQIISKLPPYCYTVSNKIQQAEHSVEALVPILQYYNRDVEIISIIVPYMSLDTMKHISGMLSLAIKDIMATNNLNWGKDVAILISNDAVHYGDQDWGGRNYAPFGSDTAGYLDAITYENLIVGECLSQNLDEEKVNNFSEKMFLKKNNKTYEWTWCGDYPVAFGLLTGIYLGKALNYPSLRATSWSYSNSINHPKIPVQDLGMGATAVAHLHHWVGYVSAVYR